MARKGLGITPGGNSGAPFGTKSGKNKHQYTYTEGKACFLHFTHTQLLVLGQRRQSPKVFLLFPCPESEARRRVRTFCAEMIPDHNSLKTFMITEYKCLSVRPLGVR